MAITTPFQIENATAIILADTTDHNPTAGATLSGTRTDQIDLTSLANNAYRQSTKFDFGATRDIHWAVRAAIEPVSAPTANANAHFWIGYSDSVTAANSNPGNLSGADAAYTGYGAAATDADECIEQLDYIGPLRFSADADIHVGEIGVILPKLRYGIIVVKNACGVALAADAIEMSIHLIPVKYGT